MLKSQVMVNKEKIGFLSILFVGLIIRFFYFPYDLPLTIDGLDNFTYASAINFYGYLPTEWSPANNGWPIFLSFWFSLLNLDNTFEYMQSQKIISVILSVLIIFPVYFLCKKFFDEKIALVGAALFAFDPRIILNSLLGITEPLFILLTASSLVIFLKYERKSIIFSFILASFATIVRSEGLFLFFALTILFFIKYRYSKEILKTYLPCVVIFLLILSPIMNYKIEVSGHDGIFQRAAYGTNLILTNTSNEGTNDIFVGMELFAKYLGWVMIPNFIIFVPFGLIQFFKKRNKETNFIIVFLIVSSPPILYAYIVQALDTRYLYVLYPIFCLISLFAVKSYLSHLPKRNTVLFLIIVGILVSSIVFYEYKKSNLEKEEEMYEIAKRISDISMVTNFHPSETKYLRVSDLPHEWPFVFRDEMYSKVIPTSNYQNLEDFISNSKGELTHILVDDNSELPEFLQDIYFNEKDYSYLNKVFDSGKEGFNHHMMLFEIDFEKFDSISKR